MLWLGPLSADEAQLFLAALSEVAAHRAGLADEIVERAGGNPFFLEQLAAIGDEPGTDSLPPTVRSVIAARLDLLDPLEQDVLLRAAVPGSRFSNPELGALLEAEPAVTAPPDQALGTLARRRLIEAERAADAYRFSGVLIRDVAYNTLSKRARLRYHEVLAAWYRHRTQSPDLAGRHLERAYRLAAELHPADPRVPAAADRRRADPRRGRRPGAARERPALGGRPAGPVPRPARRGVRRTHRGRRAPGRGPAAARHRPARPADAADPGGGSRGGGRPALPPRTPACCWPRWSCPGRPRSRTRWPPCRSSRRSGDQLGLARAWLRVGSAASARRPLRRGGGTAGPGPRACPADRHVSSSWPP